MNKTVAKKILAGALIFGALSPVAVFADSTQLTKQVISSQQGLGAKHMTAEEKKAQQEELMTWVKKYTPDLADKFQSLLDEQTALHEARLPKLDDATKAKLDEIREQVKAGTLTEDEAKAKLEELGIKGKLGGKFGGQNIDDATKAKLTEIKEKLKAGTITQEEAKTQAEALGVKIFDRPALDDATKAKLDEIREQVKAGTLTEDEAKAKLEELGIKAKLGGNHGEQNLDEATKAKLKEIREQVKAGTLTEDEAKAKLEELGIKAPVGGTHENLYAKLKTAVEANDEATIKELINQMLTQWEDRIEKEKERQANKETQE